MYPCCLHLLSNIHGGGAEVRVSARAGLLICTFQGIKHTCAARYAERYKRHGRLRNGTCDCAFSSRVGRICQVIGRKHKLETVLWFSHYGYSVAVLLLKRQCCSFPVREMVLQFPHSFRFYNWFVSISEIYFLLRVGCELSLLSSNELTV